MIKFKEVTKVFGERTVLNQISFSIQKGQILFVLGGSGVGKSVLLKNLVGLLKPDTGEIWLDGQEISKLSEEAFKPIRRKCGMVFQQPALFDSLTVKENVAFGIRRHRSEISEQQVGDEVNSALRLVGLVDISEKYPHQISYGMQKRVSFARTIAVKPEVLLFDEPTTGLDPITTTAINQLIFELSRTLGVTSIVVSHDMPCAVAIADQIIVLDKGMIVAQGNPEELKRSSVGLVQEFLREIQ